MHISQIVQQTLFTQYWLGPMSGSQYAQYIRLVQCTWPKVGSAQAHTTLVATMELADKESMQ